MNNKLPVLSWWARVSGDHSCISAYLDQFAEAGVRRLTMDVSNVRRCWEEPGFGSLLRTCAAEAGLDIFDVHAPHSSIESLGYPVKEDELFAVDSVKKSITAAAELGARTVTVHTSRTRFTGERALGGVEYPAADLPRSRKLPRPIRRRQPTIKERSLLRVRSCLASLVFRCTRYCIAGTRFLLPYRTHHAR